MNQLNQEQQRQYNLEMQTVLKTQKLPTSDKLIRWFGYAYQALRFAPLASMRLDIDGYGEAAKADPKNGLRLDFVAALANNIDNVSPDDMDVTPRAYHEILKLNREIAAEWELIVKPLRAEIEKNILIMSGQSKNNVVKMPTAQA